ncbi:hypothetical protein BC629DRAFT_551076 [Irpex lacteus]|nr:hypothetical protein BC629DRAFT_551076 [Irpex lacteus]
MILVSCVRSIRIWRYIPPPSRVAFSPQELRGTMPFARLTEFECMVDYLDDLTLQALSHCSTLRSLAVACVDDWDHCPLAFASSPNLETLRLNIFTDSIKLSSTRTFNCSYPIRTYSSITTLALHTKPHFQTLIMELFETCYFPSLRVFLVQRYGVDYVSLFQFVHRHAILLEVNIDTNQRTQTRIRVEAIFKLIDGTGTWVPPTDPRASSAPLGYIGSNRETANSHPISYLMYRSFAFRSRLLVFHCLPRPHRGMSNLDHRTLDSNAPV